METYADAVSGIAVDDVALHDDIITRERYAQRQGFADRNVGLSAHVKAADADILGAGDSGRIAAVEAHIDYYSRAIVLPAFVARDFSFSVLVYHFVPSAVWFARRNAERAEKL